MEWGVFYGVGVNRIVADKVVLSLGFELCVMLSALGEFFTSYAGSYEINSNGSGFVYDYEDVKSDEDLFRKLNSERIFTSQFFNLKLGVGFLAY